PATRPPHGGRRGRRHQPELIQVQSTDAGHATDIASTFPRGRERCGCMLWLAGARAAGSRVGWFPGHPRAPACPGSAPQTPGSAPQTDAFVSSYDGTVPGPTLRIKRGEDLRVRVINDLAEPTSVHWHGVRLPNAMDGVPGLTQAPI